MGNNNPLPENWDDDKWKAVFKAVIISTAMETEDLDDILAGAWFLGERRARVLKRRFSPGLDVVHSLRLFCWWPFKPPVSSEVREYLQSIRGTLFDGVGAKDNSNAIQTLNNAVSNKALLLDTRQLHKKKYIELLIRIR